MKERLSIVPPASEAPSMTLRQLAGEAVSDELLNDALRVKLGQAIYRLSLVEFYGMVSDGKAVKVSDFSSSVFVRYDGIDAGVAYTNETIDRHHYRPLARVEQHV